MSSLFRKLAASPAVRKLAASHAVRHHLLDLVKIVAGIVAAHYGIKYA